MKRALIYIIICVCVQAYAHEAFVPEYYSDHMVLQRQTPLHFSGQADPGARVSVRLADIAAEVRADAAGRWDVVLPAMEAGGPYTLQLGHQRYEDVYIGEVWLCSGQSNMEFRLNQDADFRKNSKVLSDPNGPAPTSAEGLRLRADDDRLHFYNMRARWLTGAYRWSDEACDSTDRLLYFDVSGGWERCTSQTAAQFSAIAYYFGRELADSLDCHIGLVLNAVGGSTCESWIEPELLHEKQPEIFDNWADNSLVMPWVRGRAVQNVGRNHRHPYQPCYLFEAGILPLRDMAMRGAIWYQGESNAEDVKEHEFLFPLMVESWRKHLSAVDTPLPLYMVQLSSIAPRQTWPAFRDSQRRLAGQMEGVWMAVSSDVGDSLDVHPRLKRPVGHRLATLALVNSYDHAIDGLLPTEPTACSFGKKGSGTMALTFGGINPQIVNAPERCFEVLTEKGEWIDARPTVQSDAVILHYDPKVIPAAVRYGWQPFTRANVTSITGWPLSTFELKTHYE